MPVLYAVEKWSLALLVPTTHPTLPPPLPATLLPALPAYRAYDAAGATRAAACHTRRAFMTPPRRVTSGRAGVARDNAQRRGVALAWYAPVRTAGAARAAAAHARQA